MSMQEGDLAERLHTVETALAVQEAIQAGAQATQAAVQAGAATTNAAAMPAPSPWSPAAASRSLLACFWESHFAPTSRPSGGTGLATDLADRGVPATDS